MRARERCRGGGSALRDPVEELTAQVHRDYARRLAQMRAKPALFRLKSFASLDAAEHARRPRLRCDGAAHGRPGGALRRIPRPRERPRCGRVGSTVSYGRDDAGILAGKRATGYETAQRGGRAAWSEVCEVRFARVERADGFARDAPA